MKKYRVLKEMPSFKIGEIIDFSKVLINLIDEGQYQQRTLILRWYLEDLKKYGWVKEVVEKESLEKKIKDYYALGPVVREERYTGIASISKQYYLEIFDEAVKDYLNHYYVISSSEYIRLKDFIRERLEKG